MKLPDITPAQIGAAAAGVISALVVLFKLDISDTQRAAYVTVLASVLGAAWKIADSIIRNGRSRALAAERATVDRQVVTPRDVP